MRPNDDGSHKNPTDNGGADSESKQNTYRAIKADDGESEAGGSMEA